MFLPSPDGFVIDPDPTTGRTVKDLLNGYQLSVEAYASGREFFAAFPKGPIGVLGPGTTDL